MVMLAVIAAMLALNVVEIELNCVSPVAAYINAGDSVITSALNVVIGPTIAVNPASD